jgi:hypothetical protein
MSRFFQLRSYALEEAQVGAALAVAGVRISAHSMLSGIPYPAQAARLLQGSAVVASNGQILPEMAVGLGVLANPARTLFCILNTAGQADWRIVCFCQGPGPVGPIISVEKQASRYQLVLYPGITEALADISDMTGLRGPAGSGLTAPLALNMLAFAALLAVADVVQATRLRLRLARSRPAHPVLTPDLLEAELEKGLSQNDTNWAVTAGRRVCPADLKEASNRMEMGLAALQAAGLLEPTARGFVLTSGGMRAADAFGNVATTAGFTLAIPGTPPQKIRMAWFRTASDVWLCNWKEGAGNQAGVLLHRTSTAAALASVRKLLQPGQQRPAGAPVPGAAAAPPPLPGVPVAVLAPPPAPSDRADQRCHACGNPVRPTAKFCPRCGADLLKPSLPGVSAASPVGRRCPNPQCGQMIPAGQTFCGVCGARPLESV